MDYIDGETKQEVLEQIYRNKINSEDTEYYEGVVIFVRHTPGPPILHDIKRRERIINVYTPESFKKYKEYGRRMLGSKEEFCTCSFCAIHNKKGL